jgi:hypothetical protein
MFEKDNYKYAKHEGENPDGHVLQLIFPKI